MAAQTTVAEVGQNLAKGGGMVASFRQAGIFPSFVVRMIGIGEASQPAPFCE